MSKRQSRSVFLSSTFSDLEKVREKVTDRIVGLSYSVVEMEHFPVTSNDTLKNSIEQLEKGCDYYVLLIGHRYGTIPEGELISITHAEYRKALELKNKNEIKDLFIFIASDEFPLRKMDIEQDAKRKKLADFIQEVKSERHTYNVFSDIDELLKGIYETFFQIDHPTVSNDVELFDDFVKMRSIIESDSNGKTMLVSQTLNKIVDGFKPIFNLKENEVPDLKHSIVTVIKQSLEEAIPYLIFDTDLDGRVNSWGIRHVIFRVETAVKLMMAIKEREALVDIGKEVGRTASIDLFDSVIARNKKLVPISLKVFIELFDYWDASGGWGKLDFEKQVDLDESTGKWILLTTNNFLTDKVGGQTENDIDHLYAFWEGYITGALNEGLSKLGEIYSSLSPDLKKRVEFPIYTKITKVEKQSNKVKQNADVFYVYFEKHAYGWALEMITNVREKAESNDNRNNDKIFVLTELAGLITNLKSKNKARYNSIIKSLKVDERKIIQNIENHKNDKIKAGMHQCIDIVTLIVQQFI